MVLALDDDVLEQVAEVGLDGTLAAGVHLEVVGDGALLAHLAVGLRKDRSGGVAELGTARFQFLERLQAGAEAGEIVLTRPHRPGAPLVLDAGTGQFRLAGRTRRPGGVERIVCAAQPVVRRRAIAFEPIELDAHVLGFDLQL